MATSDNVPGIGDHRNSTSPDGYDSLVLALRNFDEIVRINAVQSLGDLQDPRAVSQLLGRFKNDKSPKVRCHAAEALYKLGDSEAWSAFASSLSISAEDSEIVRAKAAEILGLIGDMQFTPQIVEALDDRSKLVWERAAYSLGTIKNEKEISRLISRLNRPLNEQETAISNDASPFIKALVEMGNMVTEQVLLSTKDCIHMVKTYWSDEKKEAQHSFDLAKRKYIHRASEQAFFDDRIAVISQIGSSAIPTILEILSSKTSPQALFEVSSLALGKIEDVDALSLLCDLATKSQYDSVRWISTDGIKNIFGTNHQLASTILTSIINNEKKNEIREKAIEGLGALGNPQSVNLLGTVLLDDDDPFLRLAAAKALGEIHSPDALDALVSALGTDRDVKVQVASALSLGEINNRDAIPFLEATTKDDPSVDVCKAAESALSKYY